MQRGREGILDRAGGGSQHFVFQRAAYRQSFVTHEACSPQAVRGEKGMQLGEGILDQRAAYHQSFVTQEACSSQGVRGGRGTQLGRGDVGQEWAELRGSGHCMVRVHK